MRIITLLVVIFILSAPGLLVSNPDVAQDSPDQALQQMHMADGFGIKLLASEPLVKKPVALEFDDRGRPWVVQYLQYPNPAGLKRLHVDRYSRTVYDRVPEPPPHGPRGADRITILTAFNEQGQATQSRDFVSGLNLATGLAFGHGGVFVLQVPYLLFYPDRDGDDLPDGPPEVLLAGFGMEDASSVANSLTWGPDGWLYGCQGSTVTANIRGLSFQQGIWRYHPLTHRFELFCEGGGNCWGLDFDAHGELFYSTNVGGFVTVHGVQGAYYWKQFDKHGGLSNPYAYGYFDHVPHRHFRGGHVTVGGVIYQSESFPARFQGKYLAADLLGHALYWHEMEAHGSSFRSRHGGELLLTNDLTFAPSDVTVGPDGSVYVCDWHDRRTAHPDPDAQWDRSKGRIYKVESKGTRPYSGYDLRKKISAQLVELLSSKNDWLVRKARRILADRRDPEMIFPLRRLVLESTEEQLALQALWALYVSGGFTEEFARQCLEHRNADLRRWSIRFLSDEPRISSQMAEQLFRRAAVEPDVRVRCQLACTAKRLPQAQALPLIERLVLRSEDAKDTYIPLLLWWAIERHAMGSRERIVDFFSSRTAWDSPLVRSTIQERLLRRYAAEGSADGIRACVQLLRSAPSATERQRLLAALDLGLQDHSALPRPKAMGSLLAQYAQVQQNPIQRHSEIVELAPALKEYLLTLWDTNNSDPTFLRLMTRLSNPQAQDQIIALARRSSTPLETRLNLLQTLGDLGSPDCVKPLLELLQGNEAENIKQAALAALQRYDDSRIAETLLKTYSKMSKRLQARTRMILFGRKDWARRFLEGVERGTYAAADIAVEELRALSLYKDKKLDEIIRKQWGNIQAGTPEAKLAEIRRLSNDLRAGTADIRSGKLLFRQHCGTCHRLFDEGEQVGPDLTHANRKDRDYLLVSIVDPSAVIRKEYQSYVVYTTDGRTLTGLLTEPKPGKITLVSAKNERTTIARNKIESLEESPVSLMPENILQALKPQELRDLFAYLQSEAPSARTK